MTHNHRQYEDDIDTALGILRSAQPLSDRPASGDPTPGNATHGDPGEAFSAMNARLLCNLRSRERRTTRAAWLSLPRLAFATALLAATLLGGLLLPRLRSAPDQTSSIRTSDTSAMGLLSRVDSAEPQPVPPLAHRVGSMKPVPLATVSPSSHLQATPAPTQSAAIDPAFLPSQPAPEEPLTHQERLLLNMVNRRKPTLLALLEPAGSHLSASTQPADANPFLAGFQPEPQPAQQSAAEDAGDVPQP